MEFIHDPLMTYRISFYYSSILAQKTRKESSSSTLKSFKSTLSGKLLRDKISSSSSPKAFALNKGCSFATVVGEPLLEAPLALAESAAIALLIFQPRGDAEQILERISDFVSFKPSGNCGAVVALRRRQSFVVHLAGTTRQIFQLRSDFDSANANRDDVVDDADDTDAICAPGTRSIQSSSETVASIQRDGDDLAADYVEDIADTAAC